MFVVMFVLCSLLHRALPWTSLLCCSKLVDQISTLFCLSFASTFSMKTPLHNFYHFMNLANSNAKMGAWSDVGSSMWSIEEHQLSTRKPSGCRFCGGFRGLIGGIYWCLCGFAWFSYGRRLRKCGTKWQEVLAILGLKLKFLLSACDATPNIQPFQSKCKRLSNVSNVASKFQQPSDLDPRWLTKRRSPCECLHSRGHCPTPCCASLASITCAFKSRIIR